jgi:hypothetical protein
MPGEVQNGGQPALSAHDQAMIAKVDAASASTQEAVTGKPAEVSTPPVDSSKPVRPEHIPEKFWDAEKGTVRVDDLVKSYSELEKGKAAPQEPPAEQQDPPQDSGVKAAAKAVSDAGLKDEDLVTAFQTNGDFSPEQYAAFEKAGYPNELVKNYVNGINAQARLVNMEAHAAAGGEDSYNAMVAWAGANLNQAEIAAYDKAVTGTPEDRKQAIVALKARFEGANGSEPNLLKGGGQGGQGSDAFASRAEQTAAMRDPRYRKDAAYRAEVERKTGNSNF